MATLHAHPAPFATYLAHGGLCTAHPDGVILIKKPGQGRKVWDRKPKSLQLETWRELTEADLKAMRADAPWRFAPTKLPSVGQLEKMEAGLLPLTTPTGQVCEAPTLLASDGSPSWLKFLGRV